MNRSDSPKRILVKEGVVESKVPGNEVDERMGEVEENEITLGLRRRTSCNRVLIRYMGGRNMEKSYTDRRLLVTPLILSVLILLIAVTLTHTSEYRSVWVSCA